MNRLFSSLLLLAAGAAIGAIAHSILTPAFAPSPNDSAEGQPLYWVAPMDANFRRDKPGKSPMGMDLVPVYETNGETEEKGTVTIAPEVVNNLGVRTAYAEYRYLENKITTVGTVEFDQDKLVHIHPRVEGWLDKLYVKASGETVKKGQALYAVYSPALVNAQEELVLALKRDNKRLINASKARLAAMLVPAATIEQVMKTHKVLQNITIYAMQDGVIDNLAVREGFFVKPGTTIMSIANLEQVWVNTQVFEQQAAAVNVGDVVSFTLDYLPGKEWRGMVEYIYPVLEKTTRTLQLRLRFDNPDLQLKPNMFGNVVIDTQADATGLMVPKESVIRTGHNNRVVMTSGQGQFKSVAVDLGRVNAGFIEILAGLEEGDEIVTSAQFLIDSESSVNSDFIRMGQDSEQEEQQSSVWVEAVIESLMPEQRMVQATHQAIAEWQWPVMTMDFVVASEVDYASLEAGQKLNVEISVTEDNRYMISAIKALARGEGESTIKKPSNMNHSDNEQDHSKMDHSQMNHDHMGVH
ncbi:efflux RND transporter periplasmic adaptor subunit [Psychrobium sp. 1_MG-2023]|uniref:efflux RND transporter periplasmic adaptor subunit n=1 Tax=Psychrobium sp. 1_MG-2023 TaxID=3062624 RepID=UPI000C340EC1|nr:efflux RND transporter periplasmic adaptor subunit [Psychrobium sp. 1_MG-2023]MDP2559705.1 efflux RND transporter periplasmic adaptor subunit [Psychrobium sp. 1_MG-2023]PKF59535.1 efflux transporter periplasmic adaptor subunit [Alteromonadales bacterium alter-6D02]